MDNKGLLRENRSVAYFYTNKICTLTYITDYLRIRTNDKEIRVEIMGTCGSIGEGVGCWDVMHIGICFNGGVESFHSFSPYGTIKYNIGNNGFIHWQWRFYPFVATVDRLFFVSEEFAEIYNIEEVVEKALNTPTIEEIESKLDSARYIDI